MVEMSIFICLDIKSDTCFNCLKSSHRLDAVHSKQGAGNEENSRSNVAFPAVALGGASNLQRHHL